MDTQSAPSPTFVPVASVDDVPRGWVLKVQVGTRSIALANCDGTFYALDNTCTHAGGPLGDNRLHRDCLVECPWHNSVFDVRTGEARGGPGRKPQPTYPVRVQGRTVYIGIDAPQISAEQPSAPA